MKINLVLLITTMTFAFSCKKTRNSDDGDSSAKDVNQLIGQSKVRRSVETYGVCGVNTGPISSETNEAAVKRNFNALPLQVRSILANNKGKVDFNKPNIKLLEAEALTEKCAEVINEWMTIVQKNAQGSAKDALADLQKTFEVAKSDPKNHRLNLNGCWGLTGPDGAAPSPADLNDPTKVDLNIYMLNDAATVESETLAMSFIAIFEYWLDVVMTKQRLDQFAAAVNGKESKVDANLLSFFTYFKGLSDLRSSFGNEIVNYLTALPKSSAGGSLVDYYVGIFNAKDANGLKNNSHFLNYALSELLDDRHCNLKTNAQLDNLRTNVIAAPGAVSLTDTHSNVGAVIKALDTYLGTPWYFEQVVSK